MGSAYPVISRLENQYADNVESDTIYTCSSSGHLLMRYNISN